MNTKKGFTWLETTIVLAAVALLGIFVSFQKLNYDAVKSDDYKKSAVNAMHYSLEEVFFAKNGYYPEVISAEILPTVDPTYFETVDFIYLPANCKEGRCSEYTLTVKLQKESEYQKQNG